MLSSNTFAMLSKRPRIASRSVLNSATISGSPNPNVRGPGNA
jgi:hypothetical protein